MISILRKYGINPDGNEYSIDYIENAIYNATVKWPALRCNRNKSSGKKQLYEIALCFTKVNRALQDCPYNAGTCGNKFLWNPWSGCVDYVEDLLPLQNNWGAS